MSPQTSTIDPQQIQDPSQIPPAGAPLVGISGQGLVAVYNGTIAGDIDAQPAAQELLATAPDTGGIANADYIYNNVMALFAGGPLPDLQSPNRKTVKSIVFCSGSPKGGYGAFHIPGTQQDFDRIVVDSLDASGNYSGGSGLGNALAPLKARKPRLLPVFRGAYDLQGVFDPEDARLKSAKPAMLQEALKIAHQNNVALKAAVDTRKRTAIPRKPTADQIRERTEGDHAELSRRLIHANRTSVEMLQRLIQAGGGRQYLSTALFCAEIVESFEMLTRRSDAGQTDGEAVSRIIGFKLAPEIALVPGFNSGVTQQWWQDGKPDWVNDNSQDDQSSDGNGAGVMFLFYLNDYLGVPLDAILSHMPATGGAPLGQTYTA
ncbi:MAG TPA: hypothetical protein VJ732_03545, partial [Bryobacteraceae bacterium]|nr:hypothetical protein [Bryobacteraceae bacterium]